MGAAAGWLAVLLSPSYRRRLFAQAQMAGYDAAVARASVAEAGRMTAELPRIWLRPQQAPLQDPVHWQGTALLEAALAQPRGVLILTPHLGSFEICAQAYAERYGARKPVTVLYRPARQAWLRALEETARARPHLATAPATLSGVRQLVRALRQGETVGLLPDQVPPEGQGVWAPFFGQPAYTMTLAARLARQTDAVLLAMTATRLPQGAGWQVQVHPVLPGLPERARAAGNEDADHADAAALNAAIERLIAVCPEQYLWGYARYKQPRPAASGGASGATPPPPAAQA